MVLDPSVALHIVKGVIGIAKTGASAPSKYRQWRERRREAGVARNHVDDLVEALLKAARRGASDDTDHDSPSTRHTWIILCAFGEAWGRQHAYNRAAEFAPTNDDGSHTVREQSLAVRLRDRWRAPLVPAVPDPEIELALIDSLTSDPLRTWTYISLWETFTEPALGDTIVNATGDAKLAFEQYFRLAYNEALASDPGESIRRWLHGLEAERPRLVNRLLVQRMADWDTRHVFGNISHHAQMRDLPLRDMYVEPRAKRENQPKEAASRPVRTLIRELLQEENIIVVKAHFGYGKSLTARYLTWEFAYQYLASHSPSTEMHRPIFVKCSEDLISLPVNINEAARHSIWRQQANELKLDLALNDNAHSPPSPTERAIYILDGLDEVMLGESALHELFRRLREESSKDHQFLVFSRPEALPRDLLSKHKVPVLELQPLTRATDDNQVAEWLSRWNRLHPDQPAIIFENIQGRNLEDVSTTPILLFMIAFTWHASGDTSGSVASIYERFFRQIANGKAEMDAEKHAPIALASEYLLERLKTSGELNETADRVEAMLWLLGRMAWEAHRLVQRDTANSLTRDDVKHIVRNELDLRGEHDVAQCVTIGLLLALQADLEGSNHEILFGHKSFREFLVARHWKIQLRKAIQRDDAEDLSDHMLGARLLQEGDRSFEFLRQLLMEWTEEDRVELRRWASRIFNDDTILTRGARANLREDLRVGLREAALSIGSNLGLESGITIKPGRLRSLLAWFWLANDRPILLTPQIIMSRAETEGVQLIGSDFSRAKLSNVSINCFGGNLDGAHIRSEIRGYLYLSRCNLAGVWLEQWNDGAVRLSHCIGPYIAFDGVTMRCRIDNSMLFGASMRGTRLRALYHRESRDIHRDDPDQFDIIETNLSEADLSNANLKGLYLKDVNLFKVNLDGADMRGVVGRRINAKAARVANVQWAGADIEWTEGGRPDGAPDMPVPAEAESEEPSPEDE